MRIQSHIACDQPHSGSVVAGKTTGLWTEWYETGVVRYLAEWHPEGKGEGAWFYFLETGVARDRTVYRRDIAEGPSDRGGNWSIYVVSFATFGPTARR